MLSTLLLLSAILPSFYCSPSPGCFSPFPDTGPDPGHLYTFNIPVADSNQGQVTRSYILYLPNQYQQNKPLFLVLDLHGWGGSGSSQSASGRFQEISEKDKNGFLVAFPRGEGDEGWGSFNCSRTDGPLGAPCVLPRGDKYDLTACYSSCPACDPINSCDWTSCFDDVAFMEAMIGHIGDRYCLDVDSVHLTGMSNGGMFAYFAAEQLAPLLASIVPASGSPLLGFGDIPKTPISLLDIHGTNDDTIPYNQSSRYNEGEGPHGTVTSWDGYFYHTKPWVVLQWVAGMGCNSQMREYPTSLDGEEGWQCNIWENCRDGKEVVQCTGEHGHHYPANNEAFQIIWNFMKRNRRAS